MTSPYNIIKSLIRTEKSTLYEPKNKYLFLVNNEANKIQIKQAIEHIYKVRVKEVNTFLRQGKMKRVRYKIGKAADFKRAVVTLKEGKITVT